MKFNFNVKYVVNKEKHTVVAFFDKKQCFNPDNYIEEHSPFSGCDWAWSPSHFYDNLEMHKLCGKATCSELDKFDEATGKKIAKTKLMINFYKMFQRFIGEGIVNLIKTQNRLIYFEKKLDEKIKNAQDKNKRLTEAE